MNTFRIIITVITSLFLVVDVTGQTKDLFQQGNQKYMDGNYQEAIDLYVEIIEAGFESGPLYFNLGNAYYKIGSIEKAILYYEKAKKIMPNDEDLLTNLQMANQFIADEITPIPELFYKKYWNAFINLLGTETWSILFALCYLTLGIIISGWIAARSSYSMRRLLNRFIIVFTFLTFLAGITTLSSSYEKNRRDFGIIMEEKIEVLGEPSESGEELFSLHRGTKIQIKRSSDEWIEIRIADGNVGWIKREWIELI